MKRNRRQVWAGGWIYIVEAFVFVLRAGAGLYGCKHKSNVQNDLKGKVTNPKLPLEDYQGSPGVK